MIAQLKGQIAATELSYLVLDVGGVGYQLYATGRTLARIGGVGDTVLLLTELVVREDALTLYGFADEHERAAFRLLQSVQGVGAKAALSILTTLSVDELTQAILAGDKAMVARADGIGPKLALRIVNELAQKTGNLMKAPVSTTAQSNGMPGPAEEQTPASQALVQDALSALVNLGYSRSEAFQSVQKIMAEQPAQTVSELIGLALKQLGQSAR